MPFYFRKSVSAGPFRFNFSKSGVGVSVGVKGLRIGTGPRGHYVHAGRGGLYYRATLGRAGGRPMAPSVNVEPRRAWVDNVEMVEVDSADVLQMREENLSGLLDEINAKQAQVSFALLLPVAAAVLGVAFLGLVSGLGAVLLLGVLPAWGVGKWLDSYKRTTVLYYELEPELEAAYRSVTAAFDSIVECRAKWHVEAGGAVRDLTTWKRNAGATTLVRKSSANASYALPASMRCNITPPSLRVGTQTIYFLPDAAFVICAGKVGAVRYADLRFQWQDSNFIEDGNVPSDARVIGHVWKHPNKNGGPDRRFANNYQIPLCQYEAMHLSSGSGLNELLEFSRTGVSEPFARAIRSLTVAPCEAKPLASLPQR